METSKNLKLRKLVVNHLSNEELANLRGGGSDQTQDGETVFKTLKPPTKTKTEK